MNRIFIGYDERESVAYHVLAHSILKRTTQPVSITPLIRGSLPAYTRPRAAVDSTDFSNSRFMVPMLCDYEGWALYIDCDMLMLDDVNNLFEQADDRYAVMVRKHKHRPTETTKFLGQRQHKYLRKNWSSMMLFNCCRCEALDSVTVNRADGIWLHQLGWANESIGEIQGDWNHLVGYDNPYVDTPPLLHFTSGTPCYRSYANCEFAELWRNELRELIYGSNPEIYLELNDGRESPQLRHDLPKSETFA